MFEISKFSACDEDLILKLIGKLKSFEDTEERGNNKNNNKKPANCKSNSLSVLN